MTDRNKPRIGISIGDVNGIGPEIILKSFADSRVLDFCTPLIYGSEAVLQHYKKILHLPDLPLLEIEKPQDAKKNKVNVVNCFPSNINIEPGKPTEEAGKLAFLSLERVSADIESGLADLMLTAPVNKHTISMVKENFTGHTGYLAEKFSATVLMILCSEKLKISMVTGHVPLNSVSKELTTELLIDKIELLNRTLCNDFRLDRPKIAVLALNPHGGEGGILGNEEGSRIIPAIEQVKTKGILAFGPFPADGFFGSSSFLQYDAVLAMYHDQALIPFKNMSFDDGVNYTAGLPFIRTSPDHGTAYELAGTRKAFEGSFRSALYLACELYNRRLAQPHESLAGSVG